jgi:hypothetical protein
MKPLMTLVLALSQFAWPQIKSGSVVVVEREQGKLTVASDSRSTTDTGKHDDTDCKIFAFGSKFIFTMAGVISIQNPKWDAQSVAREIWERESKTVSSTPLLQRVGDKWIEAAERVYSLPRVIQDVRKHSGKIPVIANAFFAAIDNSGKLQTRAINIGFDMRLFDATGKVKLTHDIGELQPNSLLVGGLGEVVNEFNFQATPRAKSYMSWFKAHIADLPLDRQHAELNSKFIELSILLHPRSKELGFPVDVLQLQEGTGVRWVWRKPNCAAQ